MRALMMAAGLGSRLYGRDNIHPHKILLNFGGCTLLQRHVEILKESGIDDLTLVVGYHLEEIGNELVRINALNYVTMCYNPRFHLGSILSLWTARDVLRSNADILCMDADVLYHSDLIRRLVSTFHRNCFLFDRTTDVICEQESVKLYLQNGLLVEFCKGTVSCTGYDTIGEWPGFLRLTSETAAQLADRIETFISADQLNQPYEEAIRLEVLTRPEIFGIEDITGLPWVEIDFPADLDRAKNEIFPKL